MQLYIHLSASDGQRLSLVTPTPVKIDLGLFTGVNSGGGIVVLGLASSFETLVDSDGTVAVSTLVDDSVDVVEIRRISTEGIEVIDSTIIRGTIDVKESEETTVTLDVILSVEDHSATIFFALSEETGNISFIDDTIGDLLEVDIDTGESKGRESEQADE